MVNILFRMIRINLLVIVLMFYIATLSYAMGGHGGRQGNNSIALSPVNDAVAVAYGNKIGPIKVVSLESEEIIESFETEYSVSGIVFSPDGKLIAAGLMIANEPPEGIIKVWNIASGELVNTTDTPNNFIMQFSDDSRTLLYDSLGDIIEWNIHDGTEKIAVLTFNNINHSVDPWGEYISVNKNKKLKAQAKCGAGEPVNIYNTAEDVLLKQIPQTGTVCSLFFDDPGEQLAILLEGEPSEVQILSTETWSVFRRFSLESLPGEGVFCPEGRFLYLYCSDYMVHYWDMESGEYINSISVQTVNEKFLTAAEVGNMATLEMQMSLGADINAVEPDKHKTALILASEGGYIGVVEILIAAGALVNLEDSSGMTALFAAVNKEKTDIVKKLLEAGAVTETTEHSALMRFWGTNMEIPRLLIEAGADVNAKGKGGTTVLFEAVHLGSPVFVSMLIDAGADVNQQMIKGNTPLISAAIWGNVDNVRILLEKGADVNHTTTDGKTALFYAEQCEHPEVVEILKSHGARTESLQSSENENQTEPVKILEKPNLFERFLSTVKSWFSRDDKKQETIVSAIVQPDFTENKRPLLVDAAYYGRGDEVNFLIEIGADVNLPGEFFTPLSAAAREGRTEIVRTLLKAGARVNVNGFNALCEASARGNTEIINILLGNNVNINECNRYSTTPLYYAVAGNQSDIVKLLVEAGADVNLGAGNAVTPLMAAVRTGSYELVEYLLHNGADVDAVGRKGYTALIYAVRNDYKDIEELLRTYGAEI